MAAGKSSFLVNIVEKIRPGCRNLPRFLVMVNLSEIFLEEIIKVKSLVCGFKGMGWSRVSSVDMGAGSFYW